MLDTTYLLPAFGVELDFDSAENITKVLDNITEIGSNVYLSDLSPLECFLKAFRLAEKVKSQAGKEAAKIGFLAVTKDPSAFTILSHSDEDIITEAFMIRNSHRDPFDCFIFATAKVLEATLVTEDDDAWKYVGSDKILSWKNLRKDLGIR